MSNDNPDRLPDIVDDMTLPTSADHITPPTTDQQYDDDRIINPEFRDISDDAPEPLSLADPDTFVTCLRLVNERTLRLGVPKPILMNHGAPDPLDTDTNTRSLGDVQLTMEHPTTGDHATIIEPVSRTCTVSPSSDFLQYWGLEHNARFKAHVDDLDRSTADDTDPDEDSGGFNLF
jgi:hypothetical protein